jgi:glucan 1,3-beta-glucosidase
LIYKLYQKFGEERTIDILTQHREAYITGNDFKEMASRGITQVRLPVGWWAFAPESTQASSKLITDPAHFDKMFVTITQDFLRKVLGEIKDAGLTVLIDIHAFPGGSASMYILFLLSWIHPAAFMHQSR